jgi:hypothetical protein
VKKIYILGILISLMLLTGVASALPFYGDLTTVSSGGDASTVIHVYYDQSTGQFQFVDATPNAQYSSSTGGDGILNVAFVNMAGINSFRVLQNKGVNQELRKLIFDNRCIYKVPQIKIPHENPNIKLITKIKLLN